MSALNKKFLKIHIRPKKQKNESSFVLALSWQPNTTIQKDKNQPRKFIITKSMSTKALAEVIFFLLRNFSRENGGGGCYLLGLNPLAQKLYRLIGPRCVLAWVKSKKAKEHKAIKPYTFRRPPFSPSLQGGIVVYYCVIIYLNPGFIKF